MIPYGRFRARAGLSLGVFALLCAGAAAARAPVVQEQGEESSSPTRTETDAQEVRQDDTGRTRNHEPEVEQRAITALLQKTAAQVPEAPWGLRFEMIAFEPAQSWTMGFVNRGTQTLELMLDPRWLSLTVEPPPSPPGKKPGKPSECRLPDTMLSDAPDMRFRVVLKPGDGVIEAFDPRLYCVVTPKGAPLEPGARVLPRFGVPKKMQLHASAKNKAADSQVWVLKLTDVEAALEATTQAELYAVQELTATPFILLPSSYGSSAEHPQKGPLELEFVQGADALDERLAVVTLGLKNVSEKPVYVYFRRDFVAFEGVGPNGPFYCSATPGERAPHPQAFTLLRPHEELTYPTRLAEMCPAHTFATPGIYSILARFESSYGGEQWGISAFTGAVSSVTPATVRIQRGSVIDWVSPLRRSLTRVRVKEPAPEESVSKRNP